MPFEVLHGYKPEVSHLRVFGCRAFSHISKYERRKLDSKSIKCIFISYCDDHKAYKLYYPRSHKLIASRHVVFHETTNEDKGVWNDSFYNDDYVKFDTSAEHGKEQEKDQEKEWEHVQGLEASRN